VERDAVYDLLRDRLAKQQHAPSKDGITVLAQRLARQLYPDNRALQLERQDNIKRRIQMGVKRGGADAFLLPAHRSGRGLRIARLDRRGDAPMIEPGPAHRARRRCRAVACRWT
jgi:hypothetical protein